MRAAIDAVKAAKFAPSSRDGQPDPLAHRVRRRVPSAGARDDASADGPTAAPIRPRRLRAPQRPSPTPGPPPRRRPSRQTVQVRGIAWSSPRGLGDIRVDRETLTASPRQQTSEMLSAAPGFFVDHEDGEGLGNDVYLRGFDLDNGSGIEMKVGEVPINIPLHIHGQGYADVNFIIPEVVRSIRVLEGPYDPRQGDSAIVGSALFDLGVPERGYQVKTTYGSFGQARIVGIAAPEGGERRDVRGVLAARDAGLRPGPRVEVGLGQRAVRRRPDRQRSPAPPGDRLRRERGAPRRRAAGRRERRAHRLLRRLPVLQLVLARELQRRPRAPSPRRASQSARVIVGAELDHTTGERRALRDRAVGHVDQLPLAPELHGRPQ